MDAILLAITGMDPAPWEQHFRSMAPHADIRVWPRLGDAYDVAYACVWHAPHRVLATLPRLRAVFSLGAGVDHIMGDPALPDFPVVRLVDAELTTRMTEYVVLHVLMHHRRQHSYDIQQRERLWRELEQPPASEITVGVMGLGALGLSAATMLSRLGFRVAGWSRTPKALAGIDCFHGRDGLEPFIRRTEILVCLLPATAATAGILRLELFRMLKRGGAAGGAFLVNAGRGALQIDDDILAALAEGSLTAVTLDVFANEPLPVASPLWHHPKVTITPHNAATISPQALAANILAQIGRFESGSALEHVVDRRAGY